MSRGIILPGLVTDTSLPILASWDTLIGGIPGLAAWHSARPEYLTLDEAGRALSWAPRAGSGAWTAIGAGKRPRFAAGQLNGQGGLLFDRSRLDGMVWGGARPVGAGALWSTVVVARVAPDPAIQFLLGRSGSAGISLYVGTDGSLRSYQQGAGMSANVPGIASDTTFFAAVQSYSEAAGRTRLKVGGGAVISATGTPATTSAEVVLGIGTPSSTANAISGAVVEVMQINGADLLDGSHDEDLGYIRGYIADVFGLAL